MTVIERTAKPDLWQKPDKAASWHEQNVNSRKFYIQDRFSSRKPYKLKQVVAYRTLQDERSKEVPNNRSLQNPLFSSLQIAARMGSKQRFLMVLRAINWDRCSPSEFVSAIRLALEIGLHLEARSLSADAVKLHPNNTELQKHAYVLAPPKVVKAELQQDESTSSNLDWLRKNMGKYSGRWVALRNGEMIAVADSADELRKQMDCTQNVLITLV